MRQTQLCSRKQYLWTSLLVVAVLIFSAVIYATVFTRISSLRSISPGRASQYWVQFTERLGLTYECEIKEQNTSDRSHNLVQREAATGSLHGSSQASTGKAIGLYDLFEIRVANSQDYSNPFDFNEIELQAVFSAPSGRIINFFGFYDGDGNGGQEGTIWKLRFMPDEVGEWTFSYTWTDGTPGGSGHFTVVDSGLPGPLQIAKDNSCYFETARGAPFHFRGYDMHGYFHSTLSDRLDAFIEEVDAHVKPHGYNFIMVDGLTTRTSESSESWWLSQDSTDIFDVKSFHTYEQLLDHLKARQIYVITFSGMIKQGHHFNGIDRWRPFLRYFTARFAPYYNFIGWSPTWEWGDIWAAGEVNDIMSYVHEVDPWKRLLSSHDYSDNQFQKWLGFSMRQRQSRSIFSGNCRACGQHGGVGTAFLNMPIIGSEDIWEYHGGQYGQPRNAAEVRRGAWGSMMAGVMPIYSEWHSNPPPKGDGEGEPEVRRMFDFFYSETRYREYQRLNHLVAEEERQIASGIIGEEYLVYDEDGGKITLDLLAVSPATSLSVLWYDPTSGTEIADSVVTGGMSMTLTSPFAGDSVLLLRKQMVTP